ncbi:tetratricopeptide repeat protein [Tundrisphaera sp. TA3]|uniref:tetratricopeptide repeat protein n=1 Tax=Tundrisphaera sp. TA3 TaxID=3435775 RepID=UPI003EBF03D5
MDISQSISGDGATAGPAMATPISWPIPGLAFAPSLADPAAACDRAEAHARGGRGEWALAFFRALAIDPRCPTALLPRVASGLSALGDHATALDASREAARREPGRPEALFGVAYAMKRLGYPAELAIPIADRAVEIDPGFLPARALLASLLVEAGRRDDAADLIQDAPSCPTVGACQIGRMLLLFSAPSPA